MLTLVGIGLCDGRDITLRGKHAVDVADHVYLESYTSLLQCTHGELEVQLGRKIEKLTRLDIETGIEPILAHAKDRDIVILVIGDVFGATTHVDLYLRAMSRDITVAVVHNASVMSAVGATGLELYRFGRTVSIPYWSRGFEPTSFLASIVENRERGLHTLCLLDIKAEEGRFMSVKEGIEHLWQAEARTATGLIKEELLIVGVARLGSPGQRIVAGSLETVRTADFGPPPHCVIIPGKLHPIEEEMLRRWRDT